MNILKTRDDQELVRFDAQPNGSFKLADNVNCNWINHDQGFSVKEIRPRIEPWLTSLFQSEHLSLLTGSGLTHAIHRLATSKPAAGMENTTFSEFNDQISSQAQVSAVKAGRSVANFEDQLRIANELLRGLEIQNDDRAAKLKSEI
ncbi:MAG: fibronectin-binding protein (FBP), partial [Acinetobacter sp.]